MILKVYVGEQTYPIEVPRYIIEDGDDFFAVIDRDLDTGYQMSRKWVQEPTIIHRCQIVADRILTALHSENEKLAVMMAGYILCAQVTATSRSPLLTSFTWCKLDAEYITASPAGNFICCSPNSVRITNSPPS